MTASWSASRVRTLAAIGLATSVATCVYDRDPTGVSDVRGTKTASQGGLVYAEERRTVELAGELPGLAGFFFDTSGDVVIAIKDRGEAVPSRSLLRSKFERELARARVRHPGADVVLRVVRYSFLELKAWRDRLINGNILSVPGVVWLDLDEVQNHVVIGLDVGADPVAPRVLAQDLGVPAEAIEFDVTGPYVSQQTLRDEFRPIEGGIQIQRVSGGNAVSCTLGFTALLNNQEVFLTAGHCSPNLTGTDSVAQFQPLAPLTHADSATASAIGREILQYSEPCGNRRCSYSDAALYGLIPSQTWGLGRIARPTSGCFPGPCNPPVLDVDPGPFWVIDTTYESFVVNDLVSKIGSATGWSQGSVSRTCVDVSPSSGVTYRCQMFATYGADDGDSGAPILLDIQGGADSTVTLGGIHSGRAGSNRVFSPWSGIVQDYGSLAVLPVAQQQNWPLLVDTPPQLDTARLVQLPSGRSLYRANVQLRFKDGVSDSAKVAFFSRHGMTVVGVTRSRHFFVGIPDPGPSLVSLDSLLDQLNAEPEILVATSLYFSPLEPIRDYRYPTDGPGQERADWISSTSTWAMRAIRVPLAWGCETGAYGGPLPAVGLFEWKHQANHPEFAGSSPVPWGPPDAPLAFRPAPPQAVIDSNQTHATATTGLIAAEGNNVSGMAGVTWRTGLHLYAGYSSPGNHSLPIPDNFFVLAEAIVRDRLRVLSLSADVAVDSTRSSAKREVEIRSLAADIQRDLLDTLPSLLVVVAAGNDRYRGTDSAYARSNKAAMIRAALLLLRSNPVYQNRIIVVAGTMPNNAFWDVWAANPAQGSNFYTGATEIAAPAQDVTVLDRWTGQTGSAVPLRAASGTSLSAPLVAGVAAELLTMDPSLTAAEVKGYILRGARQPRFNGQTGQVAPPPAVAGAPETVYQLDAYGSLTLLASERSGVPLCGNRVWVNNNAVIAERDPVTHSTQQLVALGEPAAWANARHGGRRIEVSTDASTRAFDLRQGQWVETPDTATTPYGGTFLSMQAYSHDLDSLVTLRYWTKVLQDSAAFEQTITALPAGTQAVLDTLWVPTANYTSTGECVQIVHATGECEAFQTTGKERVVAEVAFPPSGGRLLVAITYFVTRAVGGLGSWTVCSYADTTRSCRSHSYEERAERAQIWGVDFSTRQAAFLWSVPARVFWLGVSEDGGQVVSGEGVSAIAWTWRVDPDGFRQVWDNPGSVTDCGVRYRASATSVETAPAIPTADACITRGAGTVAPAPPRGASP